MSNFVTYQITLTAANAALIDQINALVLGTSTATTAPTSTAKTEPAAEKAAPAAKGKTTAEKAAPAAKTKAAVKADGPTFDELKEAVKNAKTAHGVEFINEVFAAAEVEDKGSLLKTVAGIDQDLYAAIIEALAEGPTKAAADELEDDGFGDDDLDGEEAEAEVTVEAVKTALKAYAKDVGREEAKEIMNKHGAATLSAVDNCNAKQLAAMFKDLQ